ncbi:MAG TPA: MYXO-CTERM sorting domain-containing protein [Polyangiaceae bacterium]|jgi:MYXO-CTERM domain-containing protein|nr:MYXO-CTERM sorting domain-containing protein [Polyangiaceae bacterium]
MRRLVASASFALVLITGSAFALDAGVDASIFDGGLPDVIVLDAASDAPEDAPSDAVVIDAAVDASDGSAIKDAAKSDACDPNVEPCTTRADSAPDTDAGDDEEPGQNGGCSCDSAPALASTTPIAFLLAAFLLMSRRRKR